MYFQTTIMELKTTNEHIMQINIDEALKLYNKGEELDLKMERLRKRRFFRQITNKNLPSNYFQNIVELENKMLREPTRDNVFELVNLYKVIFSNY